MKKLLTKNEFVALLKSKYPVNTIVTSYEDLPETIEANGTEYVINNVVETIDDTDTIVSVELNYYSKDGFAFLLPFKIYTNIIVAVDLFVKEYNIFKNK